MFFFTDYRYFTFDSSLSNRSSRSFTADTNNITNENENGNGNGISNEASTDSLWLDAGKQMQMYNMDDNKYLDAVKPFWNVITSMAKSVESKFRRIEAILIDNCEFNATDAFVMAQWFVDNFKETQTRYVRILWKFRAICFDFFFVFFCLQDINLQQKL